MAEDNKEVTNVLKEGDLVRILDRKVPGSKLRDGGLGRIHRVTEIPLSELQSQPINGEQKHPFRYDVEWVLGGRALNLGREDLIHTNADAEGLTSRATSRRKRKPIVKNDADEDDEQQTKSQSKQKGKQQQSSLVNHRKKAKKSSGGSSSKSDKTRSRLSTSSNPNNKKRGKLKSSASSLSSSNPKSKPTAITDACGEADTVDSTAISSTALDLYERHRREFLKSFVRLERVDHFGYFLGAPPPEFDEHYGSEVDENDVNGVGSGGEESNGERGEDDSIPFKAITSNKEAPASSVATKLSDHEEGNEQKRSRQKGFVTYSSTPPFNWTVVRRRMDQGRYVLDRVKLIERNREDLLSAYEEWKRQKMALNVNGECMLSNNDVSSEMRGDLGKNAISNDSGVNSSTASKTKFSGENNLSNDCAQNIKAEQSSKCSILHSKGVHWDLFRKDVIEMCDAAISRDPMGTAGGSGTVGHSAQKIKDLMEQIYDKTGKRHMTEMAQADAYHKFSRILYSADNNEAAMQGNWRKNAFPERKYQRLSKTNIVCDGLSPLDQRSAVYELETSLPDSFVGLSYTYDDIGQSEGWMKSVVGETHRKGKRRKKDEADNERRAAAALAADDGVVRAQVQTTMEVLLLKVQDRVMTDLGILRQSEKRSANWLDGDDRKHKALHGNKGSSVDGELHITIAANEVDRSHCISLPPEVAEQPVWGIDCYTRRNVALCIEVEFESNIAVEFIEKWLLPAINSCPVDVAHNISCAARILEGLSPIDNNAITSITGEKAEVSTEEGSHIFLSKALEEKIATSGPPWLKAAAHELRIAAEALGENAFRVHPKGHGSVVLTSKGLAANTLVTHYRGEVYPPWRWGEKLDAIEQTQQRLSLRPNLPDFYNMALERPRVDPRGYGLLFVDASRKAGLGSSFSHSCDPTCQVKVVAVNGKLSLAMTTLRHIERGEELTFDYNAVTESLTEYHAAICLCGHMKCRGSFLHFATADCYQEVLRRNSPIAVRFSSLMKGCMKKVMSLEDEQVLKNHGFGTAAFGAVSFNHHSEQSSSALGHSKPETLDSMENIPIWLRTYTADTLRYIEYERRALPIALLCNHFSTKKPDEEKEPPKSENAARKEKNKSGKKAESKESRKKNEGNPKKVKKANKKEDEGKADKESFENFIDVSIPDEDKKVIPGSRPEPVFLFFSREKRDSFLSLLKEEGSTNLKGLDLNRAVQKKAGTAWNSLSDEMKQYWRDRAHAAWVSNGGEEKAHLEEQRKKRVQEIIVQLKHAREESESWTPEDSKDENDSKSSKKRKCTEIEKESFQKKTLQRKASKPLSADVDMTASNISFQAADAEGWSAMEQRIHHLTQTLSRVGRVLDRHRESCFSNSNKCAESVVSPDFLRSLIHSPLAIMPDEDVVQYLWCDPEGVRLSLFRSIAKELWVTPDLLRELKDIANKYRGLEVGFKTSKIKKARHVARGVRKPASPIQAREMMSTAFLEFRNIILKNLEKMNQDAKEYSEEQNRRKGKARRIAMKQRKLKAEAMKSKQKDALKESKVTELDERNKHNDHIDSDYGESSFSVSEIKIDQRASSDPENLSLCSDGRDEFASEIHSIINAPDATLSLEDNRNSETHINIRPWVRDRKHRYKLEATADLLLLYAHTTTFFELKPYCAFESSPIEVYARELGNEVPKSVVETSIDESNDEVPISVERNVMEDMMSSNDNELKLNCDHETSKTAKCNSDSLNETSKLLSSIQNANCDKELSEQKNSKKMSIPKIKRDNRDNNELCEPDDIVTNVTVKYTGEYVLSLLLQWYSGGISLKEGLPDLLGCVMLPDMGGCWVDKDKAKEIKRETEKKSKPQFLTSYEAESRPILIDWFEDRHKRGNPWPEKVSQYFSSTFTTMKSSFQAMGSPVLDFLITGDDSNIQFILYALKSVGNDDLRSDDNRRRVKSAAERLQSSVDEGMPAQAVANWVQCENPDCMKWRKVPWHVDVDLLPDKFYCKDNKWNPEFSSCDAPEDVWDEYDTAVTPTDSKNKIPESHFMNGVRFDVQREGKEKFCEGSVVEVDTKSEVRRVKFHFPRLKKEFDEWIEMDSPRIAPHRTFTCTRIVPVEEFADTQTCCSYNDNRKQDPSSLCNISLKLTEGEDTNNEMTSKNRSIEVATKNISLEKEMKTFDNSVQTVDGGKRKVPKKPLTSFMHFLAERKPKLVAEFPGKALNDITILAEQEFSLLSPEIKRKWDQLESNDNERYKREMSNYCPPKKDPNAPKRPKNAYQFFCLSKRDELQKKHPGAKIGEMATLLRDELNKLTDEEKQPFEELARNERLRYEREMLAYAPEKEIEKKKKIEKKAREAKERADKKEREVREKAEKKKLEAERRAEKKERDEREARERVEKKEREKREKAEIKKREAEQRAEKKERIAKEKAEKKERDAMEKAEKKEREAREKAEKKVKKEKDNVPKRARTAYELFRKEKWNEIKGKNPNSSFSEMSKLVGEEFKNISEEEREKYLVLAKNNKERCTRWKLELANAEQNERKDKKHVEKEEQTENLENKQQKDDDGLTKTILSIPWNERTANPVISGDKMNDIEERNSHSSFSQSLALNGIKKDSKDREKYEPLADKNKVISSREEFGYSAAINGNIIVPKKCFDSTTTIETDQRYEPLSATNTVQSKYTLSNTSSSRTSNQISSDKSNSAFSGMNFHYHSPEIISSLDVTGKRLKEAGIPSKGHRQNNQLLTLSRNESESFQPIHCSSNKYTQQTCLKQNNTSEPPKSPPHKPKNAYHFFCVEKEKEFRRNNPEVSMKDMSALLSTEFNKLTKGEKKVYEKKSYEDIVRYSREMAYYTPPPKVSGFRKKEIGAPKRARSSFVFFSNHMRQEILDKNPKATSGEMSKLLSAAFKQLNKEEKETYVEMARKDKLRYLDEKRMFDIKKNQETRNLSVAETKAQASRSPPHASIRDKGSDSQTASYGTCESFSKGAAQSNVKMHPASSDTTKYKESIAEEVLANMLRNQHKNDILQNDPSLIDSSVLSIARKTDIGCTNHRENHFVTTGDKRKDQLHLYKSFTTKSCSNSIPESQGMSNSSSLGAIHRQNHVQPSNKNITKSMIPNGVQSNLLANQIESVHKNTIFPNGFHSNHQSLLDGCSVDCKFDSKQILGREQVLDNSRKDTTNGLYLHFQPSHNEQKPESNHMYVTKPTPNCSNLQVTNGSRAISNTQSLGEQHSAHKESFPPKAFNQAQTENYYLANKIDISTDYRSYGHSFHHKHNRNHKNSTMQFSHPITTDTFIDRHAIMKSEQNCYVKNQNFSASNQRVGLNSGNMESVQGLVTKKYQEQFNNNNKSECLHAFDPNKYSKDYYADNAKSYHSK